MRNALAVIVGIAIGAAATGGCYRWANSAPPAPALRPAVAIRVAVHPCRQLDLGGGTVADVPPADLEQFARLLTPEADYGGGVNEFITPLVAEATVTHADGTTTHVLVRSSGVNPALVSLDGKHYYYALNDPDVFDGASQLLAKANEWAAVRAGAQDGQNRRPAVKDLGPGSVRAFEDRMPVGYLGHPLGTVVRVTAVCVDGDTTLLKQYAGKALLRIEAVDGQKLPEPVDFVFDRAAAGVPAPTPGRRFHYSVHEYGDFDGEVRVPDEPGVAKDFTGNIIGLAAPGFAYRRSVTVHKAHPAK